MERVENYRLRGSGSKGKDTAKEVSGGNPPPAAVTVLGSVYESGKGLVYPIVVMGFRYTPVGYILYPGRVCGL